VWNEKPREANSKRRVSFRRASLPSHLALAFLVSNERSIHRASHELSSSEDRAARVTTVHRRIPLPLARRLLSMTRGRQGSVQPARVISHSRYHEIDESLHYIHPAVINSRAPRTDPARRRTRAVYALCVCVLRRAIFQPSKPFGYPLMKHTRGVLVTPMGNTAGKNTDAREWRLRRRSDDAHAVRPQPGDLERRGGRGGNDAAVSRIH